MTEQTAKKVSNIIDKLEQYRKFLKEYDECLSKAIVVKRDFLSSSGDALNFGYDKDFEQMIREHIVLKINDLEKQLEDINTSPKDLQESCRIISNELQKHGEFYDAFVSCVEGKLDEFDDENCVIDDGYYSPRLAEMIVKRISGEE